MTPRTLLLHQAAIFFGGSPENVTIETPAPGQIILRHGDERLELAAPPDAPPDEDPILGALGCLRDLAVTSLRQQVSALYREPTEEEFTAIVRAIEEILNISPD